MAEFLNMHLVQLCYYRQLFYPLDSGNEVLLISQKPLFYCAICCIIVSVKGVRSPLGFKWWPLLAVSHLKRYHWVPELRTKVPKSMEEMTVLLLLEG